MKDIAFALDIDIAEEIGKRAATSSLTGSAWIASRLPLWFEGEKLVEEFQQIVAGLRQTIEEITANE
jgi:hypothetical protein